MKKVWVRFIMILLLIACSGSSLPLNPSQDWNKSSWRDDLDLLVSTIKEQHRFPFQNISEQSFLEKAAQIRDTLSDMNESQRMAALMMLTASIGDAHTALYPMETESFQLYFLWLKEGIYLLRVPEDKKELLGSKLVAIDGKPIDEVITKLRTVIPHENEQWVKSKVPEFLRNSSLMYGLSIIEHPSTAVFTLESGDGHILNLDVRSSVPIQNETNAYAVYKSKSNHYPLNYINNHRDYWYELRDEDRVLYIQYNHCRNSPDQTMQDFNQSVQQTLNNGRVDKIIIDLRNNSGGNSSVMAPLMDTLLTYGFTKPGSLFVLIGKSTFSSGMLNAIDLSKRVNAILIGEPTGGKPNSYGEIEVFELPYSGLHGQYSTKYFRNSEGDPSSLMPNVLIEPSIQEWIEGRDFSLEYVIQAPL
ncbi:S41 family peptidase [Gorillibacterium sp. sgz5001074]|uniref:S41 family peptidase n=1 Tax=Gorillibacterium sp. sgz5001074 TaxID=3446695 RepID=UPI003F67AC71